LVGIVHFNGIDTEWVYLAATEALEIKVCLCRIPNCEDDFVAFSSRLRLSSRLADICHHYVPNARSCLFFFEIIGVFQIYEAKSRFRRGVHGVNIERVYCSGQPCGTFNAEIPGREETLATMHRDEEAWKQCEHVIELAVGRLAKLCVGKVVLVHAKLTCNPLRSPGSLDLRRTGTLDDARKQKLGDVHKRGERRQRAWQIGNGTYSAFRSQLLQPALLIICSLLRKKRISEVQLSHRHGSYLWHIERAVSISGWNAQ
jgi:hypothetical protein